MILYYNTEDELICQDDELKDFTPGGREIDWHGKKCRNNLLTRILYMSCVASASKLRRVSNCGNFLFFNKHEDGTKTLDSARFCKYRLCPMCVWRRSLKLYGQMNDILACLDVSRYHFIFLTFTQRNVSGDELIPELEKMLKAFKSMLHDNRRVRGTVKGFYRGLEVTYNKHKNTFHPHIHMLAVVYRDYFSGSGYIRQSEWVRFWRDAMKLDYNPVVDVRRVKPGADGSIIGAVCEVTKYPVKDSEFLEVDTADDVDRAVYAVEVLDKALFHRRLVHFGGILKDIRMRLNQDDVEGDDADLVHTGSTSDSPVVSQECYAFNYGFMRYKFAGQLPYSPDQSGMQRERDRFIADFLQNS